MKKFITDIRTLAALLMAGAAFTACSSSDDNIIDEQPVNPAQKTYTLTVNASKGDGAQTRALDLSGKTLTASWATTENVYVKEGETWATGSLQPETAGTTATLKGSLTGISIEANDNLTLQFPKSGDITYAGQQGTIADIQANFDWATANVEVESVSASGNINPKAATTTFTNQQAIIKFTLLDKADGTTKLRPSALTVTDGTSTVELTSISDDTYTANGDGVLYVAFPAAGSAKTIKLTATVGTATYIYETATAKTFTNGQYYAITVKMTNPLTVPLTIEALIDNSSITVSSPKSGMKYSKNGGAKQTVTSASIDVNKGDKVQFYGNIDYYNGTNIGGLGKLKVYGNIMSLVNEEYFSMVQIYNTLPVPANNTFSNLFKSNTSLTDASGLLLPATTLTNYCYSSMFEGCTSLTAGPTLPATTLANNCYKNMFKDCTRLTSLTCLATNISASGCIYDWLSNVVESGILYVDPKIKEAFWGIPDYWTLNWGIPSYWTVKSVAEKP